MEQQRFCQRAIGIARRENQIFDIEALEISIGNRETVIPSVVTLGNSTFLSRNQMALSTIAGLETDTIIDIECIDIIIAETVIELILISCTIYDFHLTRIVILVETLAAMVYSQTAIEFSIVSGTLAT